MQRIKIFLIITLLVSGCSEKEKPTLRSKIETAKDYLKEMVARQIVDNKGKSNKYITNYLLPASNKGLRSLDSQSFMKCPVLIQSVFSVRTDEGIPPVCRLLWLENNFKVKGMMVLDEKGMKYEYKNIFNWSPEDKDWVKYTVSRAPSVLVYIKGHYKQVEQGIVSKRKFLPPLNLPLNAFRGKLKVGLIMQDGSHTELIDAYIPPGFIDPCSLNQ